MWRMYHRKFMQNNVYIHANKVRCKVHCEISVRLYTLKKLYHSYLHDIIKNIFTLKNKTPLLQNTIHKIQRNLKMGASVQ